MSEPKWTPAQRAAIEDRGGTLLVSAAAGSGKTAVLTERAVRLITDPDHPVDADKLLIVTFTNAAAAELRARIGQALLKRSQQEPGNTALRRQRMLLQRAPICTIDAFCLDLLHKHFQALDIPPDFAPADPGSVEVLKASALAETLEHAYADPDFCAFADLYGKGRTDKPAGDTILNGNCCVPPSWTAGRTTPRKWPMPKARRRLPPFRRPRLPSARNTPKPRAVWNGLPPCWGRWSVWQARGSGRRCTTGSPPLCWAWRRCRA